MQPLIKLFKRIIFLSITCTLVFGCKKLVDVDVPRTRVASTNVFENDATAIGVLNGIYGKMSSQLSDAPPTIPNISFWAGLSADEFTLWSSLSPAQAAYHKNDLSAVVAGGEFWKNAYSVIYSTNAAIEGLNKSSSLTKEVKQQLLGESKFLRALFYFYLVNLYGDVPIVLLTDYKITSTQSRESKGNVYQQIIKDLKEAEDLLADEYIKADGFTKYSPGTEERVRPNKYAARALLARVYLYNNDFVNAEMLASSVINNSLSYQLTSLQDVFLKNSKEAIWQLQPVLTGFFNNTPDAYLFGLIAAPAGINYAHPVSLSQSLLNSFEAGDKRNEIGTWVNEYSDPTGTYFYPYKYKDVTSGTGVIPTEYIMILRLAEQYLIRSEARAQQNKIADAQSDLNMVRNRAGLSNTNADNKTSLLAAILHERQVELFSELGHRWLDLKRTGNVDAVMSIVTPLKGGTWKSTQQLYPIQERELQRDPNLHQNQGY